MHRAVANLSGAPQRLGAPAAERNSPASDQVLTI
jgi:hypothetical protein